LAQKLAELRRVPFANNSPESHYWKYALYSLVAICFISLLNTAWKKEEFNPSFPKKKF
jgi:hypothetical protein